MRFPLFIVAKPQDGLKSMGVVVGVGKMKIESNAEGSTFNCYVNGKASALEFETEKTSVVQIEIVKAGSERFINAEVVYL